MNNTYPYPYSAAEARKRNELSLWRESHRANIACRNAIEDAIRQNFDGMNLQTDCLKTVLDEYGFKRTAWVLANTLHELKWDGRFSYANKHWAEKIYIPTDLITTAILLSEAIRPCWMASSVFTARRCRL